MPTQSRQLAAIMFTDIVGYTALMGEDEQRAFELLKKNRSVQRPIIEKHNGRWLKEIGDGVLASFNSVSEAVYCAKEIQKACENEPDLKLRIGIHEGEVVFEGDDVFGDGVNIASRLEPLAPIGGILVSEAVHKNLLNKKGIESTFIREEQLKNVREPVRIYQVKVEGVEPMVVNAEPSTATPLESPKSTAQRKVVFVVVGVIAILLLSYFLFINQSPDQVIDESQLDITDKSIAVLPFVNMSNDPDQEYFSDGISEELLNALVKIQGLKVVGRTSSWAYKGTLKKDLKTIGKELGVTTILEGSVRKSGNFLRITAQLVNTEDGFHLWSETYDIELIVTEIFAVQDKITAEIVQALRIHLEDSVTSLKFATTVNDDAYMVYLQARQKLSFRGEENLVEAKELFEKAISLDPSFDQAYSGLGRTLALLPYFSVKYQANDVIDPAKDAANKSLELNPKNSESYSVLGNVAFFEWDWPLADEMLNKALQLDPNNAEIYNMIGDYYLIVGNLTKAIEMESKALELDPLHAVNHHDLGMVYAAKGEWVNALRYATSAQNLHLDFSRNDLLLVKSFIKLGRLNEAKDFVNRLDDDANPHHNLHYKALISITNGENDLALTYTEQLIELDDVYSPIAEIYSLLGMSEEAAFWLEKAYENRELNPEGLHHEYLLEILQDPTAIQADSINHR